MDSHHVLISLNMVPKVGAIHTKRLINAFGSEHAIAEATISDIMQVEGFSEVKAERVYTILRTTKAEEEKDRAIRLKTSIITWEDPRYPPQLLKIPNPPLALYVTGNINILSEDAIGVVGTRHPSTYGQDQARQFGLYLASSGFHVISGLAEGIDASAHHGALLAQSGKTIAVIGGALDQIYPASNKPLAREIVQSGGAVISEYPFGRKPDWQTFPMRNRIVSGLVEGLVVIESPLKSGTRITVDYAEEYGRSIFILPGRVDTPGFQGSHAMLRSGVGRLVTRPMDVIEAYSSLPGLELELMEDEVRIQSMPKGLPEPAGMTPDQLTIWRAIPTEGASSDTIITRTQLPAAIVMPLLIQMQLTRKLSIKPGGIFYRNTH